PGKGTGAKVDDRLVIGLELTGFDGSFQIECGQLRSANILQGQHQESAAHQAGDDGEAGVEIGVICPYEGKGDSGAGADWKFTSERFTPDELHVAATADAGGVADGQDRSAAGQRQIDRRGRLEVCDQAVGGTAEQRYE